MAAMAHQSNAFIEQAKWEQCLWLEQKLAKMKGLISGFKLSKNDWPAWYTKPDFSQLPGMLGTNAADKVSVCKLLICKVLRPDY